MYLNLYVLGELRGRQANFMDEAMGNARATIRPAKVECVMTLPTGHASSAALGLCPKLTVGPFKPEFSLQWPRMVSMVAPARARREPCRESKTVLAASVQRM